MCLRLLDLLKIDRRHPRVIAHRLSVAAQPVVRVDRQQRIRKLDRGRIVRERVPCGRVHSGQNTVLSAASLGHFESTQCRGLLAKNAKRDCGGKSRHETHFRKGHSGKGVDDAKSALGIGANWAKNRLFPKFPKMNPRPPREAF